jgi:pyruvate kinase
MRKAKIVATIGPSSSDPAVLKEMIQNGMDVARLNFSHGTQAEYRQIILSIRQLARDLGKPVTILQDLQGPKLRVGEIPGGSIILPQDKEVYFVEVDSDHGKLQLPEGTITIPIDIPDLSNNLVPGKQVLLDDGKIGLMVLKTEASYAKARVITGGLLKSRKGINLPGIPLELASMTEKDHEDLRFGLQQGVDAVALSFVQTDQDVILLRNAISAVLGDHALKPFIIAKLERPEAIQNLEPILEVVDGVMVARGDLAVETTPEDVPIMQKVIINAANRKGKLVITATQMLESMIESPRPTRAEASDVANAIFDGTDAIMLSGETAVGKYPVESVQMMNAIVLKAEGNFSQWGHFIIDQELPAHDDAVSTTRAARELAHDRDVNMIVVFTVSGKSALLMSKAHPNTIIIGFTPQEETYFKLPLFWGVQPFTVPFANSVEEMISNVEPILLENGLVTQDQQVIVVCGYPVGRMCPPNLAMLHRIGSQ